MTPDRGPSALRTIEILPLSAREEIANVVRLAVAILAGVWLYLAASGMEDAASAAGPRALLPYQTVASALPDVEQRMFRGLQEALLEAENVRSTDRRWPDPATLAADGIPPFAPDPTAKRSAYAWQLIARGAIVNYVGVPADRRSAGWLVLIQEPEPGAPPDPAAEDEEHNKLPDGTMLHVSIWKHEEGGSLHIALTGLPQAVGWTQIYGREPVLIPKR